MSLHFYSCFLLNKVKKPSIENDNVTNLCMIVKIRSWLKPLANLYSVASLRAMTRTKEVLRLKYRIQPQGFTRHYEHIPLRSRPLRPETVSNWRSLQPDCPGCNHSDDYRSGHFLTTLSSRGSRYETHFMRLSSGRV